MLSHSLEFIFEDLFAIVASKDEHKLEIDIDGLETD